ncbi:hypothetical protein VTI74DRAFT_2873 [Chaetomium olivicolor]
MRRMIRKGESGRVWKKAEFNAIPLAPLPSFGYPPACNYRVLSSYPFTLTLTHWSLGWLPDTLNSLPFKGVRPLGTSMAPVLRSRAASEQRVPASQLSSTNTTDLLDALVQTAPLQRLLTPFSPPASRPSSKKNAVSMRRLLLPVVRPLYARSALNWSSSSVKPFIILPPLLLLLSRRLPSPVLLSRAL